MFSKKTWNLIAVVITLLALMLISSLLIQFMIDKNQMEDQINDLTVKINDTKVKSDQLENEVKELEKKNNNLKKETEKLKSDNSTLKKTNKNLEKKNRELQASYDKLYKKHQEEIRPVSYNKSNVTSKSYASANDLEKVLAKTGLQGLGYAYVQAEKEYGVNAIFLLSITALESGWGTSNRARRDNNLSGFEVYNARSRGAVFSSKEESIMTTARLLSTHYLVKDGKNYHGLSARAVNIDYCPDGGYWSGKVNEIASEIVSRINSH